MRRWRRWWLWMLAWVALFVAAGLLGEKRGNAGEVSNDERGGCVEHEWVALNTCGTGIPTYLRVDSVVAFGSVEVFGLHSPEIFEGCISILIANRHTIAVRHTTASFLSLIHSERGKWRRCRYKLQQIEVQIEGAAKGSKVDISAGGVKQVDVNIEAP